MISKRTASHHDHYQYVALDQLVSASKLKVISASSFDGHASELLPLHSKQFAYDVVGNLIAEIATDHISCQSHTLRHDHGPFGNSPEQKTPSNPNTGKR
ncbi:hypothetical protein [Diaphorobacter caeni]|uniref:hypothetical protein n=1 Tax=Diaphorobacter caeni TaxID=2784387 RepID=UPI0018905117|nr:hypothetical protein [Diaphorobacter caeni]MBF5006791.1 hypothetical protein [Diaphorobacter caeni]